MPKEAVVGTDHSQFDVHSVNDFAENSQTAKTLNLSSAELQFEVAFLDLIRDSLQTTSPNTNASNGGYSQTEALDLSNNLKESQIDCDKEIINTEISGLEDILDTFPRDTRNNTNEGDLVCNTAFEQFTRQIDNSDISHIVATEDFLIDFLQYKMNNGLYEDAIKALKQISCVTDPRFLQFWDEAHYRIYRQSNDVQLTPLQKHRIRKRNKPPSGICIGGRRPSLRMPDESRAILYRWYTSHAADPYPSRKKKIELSTCAGITLSQVNTWFSNARRKRRSNRRKLASNSVTIGNHVDTLDIESNVDKENYVPMATLGISTRSSVNASIYDVPGTIDVQNGWTTPDEQPQNDKYTAGLQPSDNVQRLTYNAQSTVLIPSRDVEYDENRLHQSLYHPSPSNQEANHHGSTNQELSVNGIVNGLDTSTAKHGQSIYKENTLETPTDINRLPSNECPPFTKPVGVVDGTLNIDKVNEIAPRDDKRNRDHKDGTLNTKKRNRFVSVPSNEKTATAYNKRMAKMKHSVALQRLRRKLKGSNPRIAKEAPGYFPSAIESLLSLRKLCDTLEDVVMSPTDYAMSVNFDECDDMSVNEEFGETDSNSAETIDLTDSTETRCTSGPLPWVSMSSPSTPVLSSWTPGSYQVTPCTSPWIPDPTQCTPGSSSRVLESSSRTHGSSSWTYGPLSWMSESSPRLPESSLPTPIASPWLNRQCPYPQWTRIKDTSPQGFVNIVSKSSMNRAECNSVCSNCPRTGSSSPHGWISPDYVNHQYGRDIMPSASEPVATHLSIDTDQTEYRTKYLTDVDLLDTTLLQDSYGTVVGEAIQGLLNLSSQESDTSL